MKYEITMRIGTEQNGVTIHTNRKSKGKMDDKEIIKILDGIYFREIVKHDTYRQAIADVTSTSPVTDVRFSRIEGSNSVEMWRQS